jgi:hypothetical protein
MISTCNAYKHVFKKKNYGKWLFIDDLRTKRNLDLLIRNLPNMEKRFPMDSPSSGFPINLQQNQDNERVNINL